MKSKKTGAGRATNAGIDFQIDASTWVCSKMLAEESVGDQWAVPNDVTISETHFETSTPLDDLVICLSNESSIYCQVKTTLSISDKSTSTFYSVIDQIIRQVLYRPESSAYSFERKFNLDSDRIAIIVGSESKTKVNSDLKQIFDTSRNFSSPQSLSTLCKTQSQEDSLTKTTDALKKIYKEHSGNDLTDEKIFSIFQSSFIVALDFDTAKSSKMEACRLLSRIVQGDPDLTWSTIRELVAKASKKSSGFDLFGLRKILSNKKLVVNHREKYSEDIKKLEELTASELADYKQEMSGVLPWEGGIKVERDITEKITNAAKEESLLIVGDAGTGKSSIVYDVAERLISQNLNVILLRVDRLDLTNKSSFDKSLNISCQMEEALNAWSGAEGVLVLDGLDAARKNYSVSELAKIISAIKKKTNWRIVASIRRFDLKMSSPIKKLFSGNVVSDQSDSDLDGLNYALVNDFQVEEIKDLLPVAFSSVINADDESKIKNLILNPFNLRLSIELVQTGTKVSKLDHITSQNQLLDLYWEEKVIRSDVNGDAREHLLTAACDSMLDTQSLIVRRKSLVEKQPSGEYLTELLSENILRQWTDPGSQKEDRYRLQFSHHIVFDYAMSRLVFRQMEKEEFKDFLNKKPLSIVSMQPSIQLYLTYLWELDHSHQRFWEIAYILSLDTIENEVVKLPGPKCILANIKNASDLDSLINDLKLHKEGSESLLRHLLAAYDANYSGTVLLSKASETILPRIEELVENSRTRLSSLTFFLSAFVDIAKNIDGDIRNKISRATISILDHILSDESTDRSIVVNAIRNSTTFFFAQTVGSSDVMRKIIEPERMKKFGFRELPWLAWGIKEITNEDAALSRDIYIATMTFKIDEDDQVPIGSSKILPMSTSKRNSLSSAEYSLSKEFNRLIEASIDDAITAALVICDNYIDQSHRPPGETFSVSINGDDVEIKVDMSSIWDCGTYSNDHPIEILDRLYHYVRSQIASGSTAELLTLHKRLKEHSCYAVFWSRIFDLAGTNPTIFTNEVATWASAEQFYTAADTCAALGKLVQQTFGGLSDDLKQSIERAIVASDKIREEKGLGSRYILLLQLTDLVTADAKTWHQENTERRSPTLNKERPQVSFGRYTTEDYLKEQGVDTEGELYKQLSPLAEILTTFTSKHLNSTPSFEEVREMFKTLVSLYDAVLMQTELNPRFNNYLIAVAVQTCARFSKNNEVKPNTEIGDKVKECLLNGLESVEPEFDQQMDEQFADSPSWGSPIARIEAAEGIFDLLGNEGFAMDAEIVEASRKVVRDPVASVRHQGVVRLLRLYKSNNDLMWEHINLLSSNEKNGGITHSLVSTLRNLAGKHPTEVLEKLNEILQRSGEILKPTKTRNDISAIFCALYLYQNNNQCREFIEQRLREDDSRKNITDPIIAELRDAFKSEVVDISNRTIELASSVVQIESEALTNLDQTYSQGQQWSEADIESARDSISCLDSICMEFYFSCGVYDDRKAESAGPLPRQLDLYVRAKPLLQALKETSIPAVIQRLVEVTSYFSNSDPKSALLEVADLIESGKRGGYQFESLAVNLIVDFVNGFLADHRALVVDDQQCGMAVVKILDAFVAGGWSKARQMVYTLEELYR